MKKSIIKLFTVSLLSFWSISSFAQMNVSTNLRQDGVWDEEKKEWTWISFDDEELTFIEFNEDYTMFIHTTPSLTSSYIIKSWTENTELNQYELEIVSDVGNKYLMIIDSDNEGLRFLYKRDGELRIVRHAIKKVWIDEDA